MLDLLAESLFADMEADLVGSALLAVLDDEYFARLEIVGEVKLPKEARDLIVMYIYLALESEDWLKRGLPQHLDHLPKVASKAAALASTIRGDDDRLAYDYSGLLEDCDHLVLVASYADGIWPPRKRGRKDDSHVDHLLTGLADTYRAAGGKTTVGGGPYTEFLASLWDGLPANLRRRLTSSQDRFIARAEAMVPKIKAREREVSWRF